MAAFAVVGYYPDNDQPYVSVFEADDWMGAVELCRAGLEANLCVVAVLHGDVSVADDFHSTLTAAASDDEADDEVDDHEA